MGTVTNGFDARLANRPFLVFWLSGTLALNPERQFGLKNIGYPAWRRIPELM